MSRPLLRLVPLALLAVLAACSSVPSSDGAKSGPFYTPTNFQGQAALPATLRRVVILPISDDGKVQEDTLTRMDESLLRSINQAQRFECVPLSREDLHRIARIRSIRSVDVLPHDFLKKVASAAGADAVLFTDITRFDPYAPLALGVRCKLATVADASMVWTIDESFDAGKAPVANAARRYWLAFASPDSKTDMSHTALESPSRFAEYVFSACFSTMPERRK